MATIGIMDSGVGGLSVLKEILRLLPDGKYVYYADNANCPYGEKSPEFIRERCRNITEMMLSKGAQAMVLACNTATAAAVQMLRAEYSIPFIGMEPAVKPAALMTRSGVVGVLATAGTLKGPKYRSTRGRFENDVRIVERVGRGFVELVESGELTGPHAEEVVAESLTPLLAEGADTVVLGCTHYPFLLATLQKIAGPGISFIDPAPAVARHLKDVLTEHNIPLADASPGIELYSSGAADALKSLRDLLCFSNPSRLTPTAPFRGTPPSAPQSSGGSAASISSKSR
jgi:glutamate racemase